MFANDLPCLGSQSVHTGNTCLKNTNRRYSVFQAAFLFCFVFCFIFPHIYSFVRKGSLQKKIRPAEVSKNIRRMIIRAASIWLEKYVSL